MESGLHEKKSNRSVVVSNASTPADPGDVPGPTAKNSVSESHPELMEPRSRAPVSPFPSRNTRSPDGLTRMRSEIRSGLQGPTPRTSCPAKSLPMTRASTNSPGSVADHTKTYTVPSVSIDTRSGTPSKLMSPPPAMSVYSAQPARGSGSGSGNSSLGSASSIADAKPAPSRKCSQRRPSLVNVTTSARPSPSTSPAIVA